MSGKPKKKASDLQSHFRARLHQRYGIALGDRYAALNRQIQTGVATFIAKESNSRSHWDLEINGQIVRVVYNKELGAIATALPRNAGLAKGE